MKKVQKLGASPHAVITDPMTHAVTTDPMTHAVSLCPSLTLMTHTDADHISLTISKIKKYRFYLILIWFDLN